MDRHLLSGAFLLLLLELTILLGDLQILPFNIWGSEPSQKQQNVIGQLISAEKNVRRRSQDAIMWESPKEAESLYTYDSVLTLSHSSAKLNLQGDIQLHLHENTLVVLEPLQNTSNNGFRLQFSHGNMRSRIGREPLEITSEYWDFDATPGSEISLKAVSQDNLEMEVLEGQVKVKDLSNDSVKNIQSGHRAVFQKNQMPEVKEISESLWWSFEKDQRVYSHSFPVEVTLKWSGSAESLRMLRPDGTEVLHAVTGQKQIRLSLGSGSYSLTLHADNKVSRSLSFSAIPAPKIKYLSPLPRDRVKTGTQRQFSWLPVTAANSYRLEIARSPKFEQLVLQQMDPNSNTKAFITDDGRLQWRVVGIDADGFEIPPYYSNALYSELAPLPAPKLIQHKLRGPASPKKESRPRIHQPRKNESKKSAKEPTETSWIKQIWDQLFPSASAENSGKTVTVSKVIFSWYPVSGADHYIIEISQTPEFNKPVVVRKVKQERFAWKDFKKTVYYWRVAAGQEGGRLGYFSESATADLRRLSDIPIDEVAPGVSYEVTKTEAPPIPTAKPSTSETHSQALKPDAPLATANKVTSTPKLPEKPAAPKLPALKYKGSAWYELGYQNTKLETGDNVTATMNGVTPLSAAVTGALIRPNAYKINYTFHYSQINWKPESETKLPFQPELKEHRYKMVAHYLPATWPVAVGVQAHQLAAPKRKDVEEITLNEHWFYGLSARYDYRYDKRWRGVARLGIAYGDQSYSLDIHGRAIYSLSPHIFTGATLDSSIISGNTMTGFQFGAGLIMGANW